MAQKINAVKFGLPGRTDLEKTGRNHYSILIKRKSRILLKDGEKIIEKIKILHEFVPGAKIDLMISSPICSKAVQLLKDNAIDIVRID